MMGGKRNARPGAKPGHWPAGKRSRTQWPHPRRQRSRWPNPLRIAGPIVVPLIAFAAYGALDSLMGESSYTLSGFARVIDGDTIELKGERIRFNGIDAPEMRQTCMRGQVAEACGRQSGAFLEGLIGGHMVACTVTGTDQYDRLLARCSQGDTDLNRAMVWAGQAVAYWRYSWRYVPEEFSARWGKRGIWQTEFVNPETWRHS